MPRAPDRSPPPRPRGPARDDDTERVYGLNAVLALFARRPADVLRIAHTRDVRREVAPLLRDAAARRVPYNEVDDDELTRIAGAIHHEGLCVTARAIPSPSVDDLADALVRTGGAAIALDGLANPHNQGAIVRSAAYFGAEGVVLAAEGAARRLPPAAVRVAEGGAEWVRVVGTADVASALARLRSRGVRVVGTDSHARRSALSGPWPRPCVVVIGNERHGLSAAVRALCDETVAIPGTGHVESLNASVAAGVLLAVLSRPEPGGSRGSAHSRGPHPSGAPRGPRRS